MSEPQASSPLAPSNGAAAPATSPEAGATTAQDSSTERPVLEEFRERMKAGKEAAKAKRAAEAAANGEATEQGEPEKKETPKPKGAPTELDAAALFTEEALSTPEGIKKAVEVARYAKEWVEQRNLRLDRLDMRIKGDRKAFDAAKQTHEQEKAKWGNLARAMQAEIQTMIGSRDAEPMQIFRSLDRLSGGNGSYEAGVELFERMAKKIASDGKAPPKSRYELEMEQRIQQMQDETRRKEQLAHEQATEAQIAHASRELAMARTALAREAASDTYPHIKAWVDSGRSDEEAVGQYLEDLMFQHAQAGTPLDRATAIGILNSNLAPLGAGEPPQGARGGAEPVNGTRSQPKPGARQSTVLPTDADQSRGVPQKETDEQRIRRLARDPNYMKRMFGRTPAAPQ
jgi:hypothetical protein